MLPSSLGWVVFPQLLWCQGGQKGCACCVPALRVLLSVIFSKAALPHNLNVALNG